MTDSLVRSADQRFSFSGTTSTLNFSESTPLDDTHLLVCIASINNLTAMTLSGWTEVSGGSSGGGGGSNQLRMWVKQGDGTTNGVTVVRTATVNRLTLLAFAGFVSTTPLASGGSSSNSLVTSRDIDPPSTPSGAGVVIAVLLVNGMSAFGAWSDGFDLVASDLSSTTKHVCATLDYDGSAAGTTATWTTTSATRWMSAILPLVSPTTYALGSTPVTLALGDTPVTGQVG